MSAFTREEMTRCTNCGHRGIHHHPRAHLCLAADGDGEFCGCEAFEKPNDDLPPYGTEDEDDPRDEGYITPALRHPDPPYMGMTEDAFAGLEAAEPVGRWECPLCGDIGTGSPSEHLCPTPVVHRMIDEAAARRLTPSLTLSDKARLALAKARRKRDIWDAGRERRDLA